MWIKFDEKEQEDLIFNKDNQFGFSQMLFNDTISWTITS